MIPQNLAAFEAMLVFFRVLDLCVCIACLQN